MEGSITMDIATLSIGLSQMKIAQQANLSVMKMAMNDGESKMSNIVKMLDTSTKNMERTVNPHIGGNIDIKL